jgi:hypothetical protein
MRGEENGEEIGEDEEGRDATSDGMVKGEGMRARILRETGRGRGSSHSSAVEVFSLVPSVPSSNISTVLLNATALPLRACFPLRSATTSCEPVRGDAVSCAAKSLRGDTSSCAGASRRRISANNSRF